MGMIRCLFPFVLCLIFACSQSKQEKEFGSNIVANEANEKALDSSLIVTKAEEKKRLASLTTISMDRLVHDFGTIVADEDYKTTFLITNTGNNPLMIYEVKASCGCTVPTWNKNPIAPGASDKIDVTFHPKSEQVGLQNKTVSVITNSTPGVEVLQIKALVNPKK